jgi:hypothetical protein
VNRAVTVGGALEGFVVNSDEVCVAGELEVGFDEGDALRQGTAKSGESVFRGVTGRAPMSNGQHESGVLLRTGCVGTAATEEESEFPA